MPGLMMLTEPWDGLPAGAPRVALEDCEDGTTLVQPRTPGGEPAWVPTHLLTAHRPPDPFVPYRR